MTPEQWANDFFSIAPQHRTKKRLSAFFAHAKREAYADAEAIAGAEASIEGIAQRIAAAILARSKETQ